jgi:hypothetical protein
MAGDFQSVCMEIPLWTPQSLFGPTDASFRLIPVETRYATLFCLASLTSTCALSRFAFACATQRRPRRSFRHNQRRVRKLVNRVEDISGLRLSSMQDGQITGLAFVCKILRLARYLLDVSIPIVS